MIYYHKTDEFFVEILSSHNQEPLKNNATFVFPLDYEGLWNLNSSIDSTYTVSHWDGKKWMRTIRLFTTDNNNQINGIVIVGIQERNEIKLGETFHDKTFYSTGICFQLTERGETTFHPHLPNFFKSNNQSIKNIGINKESVEGNYTTMRDSTGIDKYLFYKYHPANFNNIVIEIPKKEMFASLAILKNGIIIAVLVIITLIYLSISYIARTITSRLDQSIRHAKLISKGDLTSTIKIDSSDELSVLSNALNKMSSVLKDTVAEIITTIKTVNKASTELIQISDHIIDTSNKQASTLEEISSSMEEIASGVEQNNSNAQETESISNISADNIQTSSIEMQESVSSLTEIANKISLINDISSQTNILALNAAVEAARAGMQGKGFSVVAKEVRNLAEKSQNAADEINKAANTVLGTTKNAEKNLSQHVPMVSKTAELVKEITISSIEQNKGIEQINYSIQNLNNISQQNALEAENIKTSIFKLSQDSEKLNSMIDFFTTN